MDKYSIIKRPLATERATEMREHGRYVFVVDTRANKIEIKHAVEGAFNVNVTEVRTMNMQGKFKRLGLKGGKRSDWKKAIVTLKDGEKISILEG